MLPYWHYPTYSIGGLTLQTWGTFVALGILLAVGLAYRRAKTKGLAAADLVDLGFWMVIAAFLGARLGHVFLYDWGYYREHLNEIGRFWEGGLSSYGGFVGGALVGAAFLLAKHRQNFWQYADAALIGLPLGFAVGRIGCFLTHLHPGIKTDFFLGVQYPDGIRHDLGLYDGLNTLGLAIFLFIFRKKFEKRPGAVTISVMLWYGGLRFFLDFLRAFDARYLGLTPAQYGSIAMVIGGVWLAIQLRTLSKRLSN
ncbi:prolipoprotein diacylglyceryl transferase [Candidatus Uhrbacteria bacterium]|nr:prolipoprotein diacylglyceryl transferase [Candidatus Uhrbacteria bacterium]